jgi:nicotinamide riboside transporter PnuC
MSVDANGVVLPLRIDSNDGTSAKARLALYCMVDNFVDFFFFWVCGAVIMIVFMKLKDWVGDTLWDRMKYTMLLLSYIVRSH